MSSLKFFTHTCRKCKLTFRLLLRPDHKELLPIRCPDCRTRAWLDNRDGGLARLKRKRLLSRPIREYDLKPGIDYVDPRPAAPPPLELSANLPAALTAPAPEQPRPADDPNPAAAIDNLIANPIDDTTNSRDRAESSSAVPVPETQRLASQAIGGPVPASGPAAAAVSNAQSGDRTRSGSRPAHFAQSSGADADLPIQQGPRRPPWTAQLKGSFDALSSRLYLLRYRLTNYTASRYAALRAACGNFAATVGGGARSIAAGATDFSAHAWPGLREAGNRTLAWAGDRLLAGGNSVKVYARSLWLAATRLRRSFQARRGDLGPAIRRRLLESRFYPRVTLERLGDAAFSVADYSAALRDGIKQGPSIFRRRDSESELNTSPTPVSSDRLHWLRAALWSERLPGPVLAGAYLSAPIVLLFLYIGASFAFPRLALSESFEVFAARLQPVQPNRILDREGGLLAELFSRKTSNIRLTAHAARGSIGSGGAPEIIDAGDSSAASDASDIIETKETMTALRPTFPESLKQKLLFVEDESFYEHGGVRPLAILRAFVRNLAAGRYVEGGSTITQQVARMALRNRSRSLTRKFQEAVLCRQLESRLSKDEILTAYINHVYMGHGAYGMQVAAAFFFDRRLDELNFAEELMLVTVLPAPAEYSPLRNPARLEQRMDLLYNRMVRENFPRIAADAYRHQKNLLFGGLQDQSPNQSVFASRTNHAPYVAEYVRLALRSMAKEKQKSRATTLEQQQAHSGRAAKRRRAGRSEREADASGLTAAHIAELFRTGVTIHTSIDPGLQKAATRITPRYIGEINPRYPPYKIVDGKPVRRRGLRASLAREYEQARLGLQILGVAAPVSKTPRLQAAAIGVAPKTGAVLFMQGGAGFRAGNQLNHAISMRRQTGSAIKPFVYAAAIESGRASPASILNDRPFPEDGPGPEEDPEWKPRNYKDDYHGKVSARFALKKSLNIPTIQLASRTGMSRLALQFQKFFFPGEAAFRKRFRRDLTVAIGSLEMSPLEMAVAYTAFGNNGIIRRPYLIEKIVARDGTVLFARGNGLDFDEFNLQIPETRQVIPGDVAHVMASMLRDSAKMGGAGYWSRFTLGKTGTSNHHRDAWFVGVLPEVSTAVWVGYDQPTNSMGRATGAAVAGPLWARIIGAGMGNRSPGQFHFDPHGVYHRVCVKTGARATARCPHTKKEIFPRDHTPGRCWKHAE
ncbi:MAG: transglycosylase domain-containing protein [bacterium]|nr:transglycosylase domain-containing protein [bacterium]